jgi:hypothetical protein
LRVEQRQVLQQRGIFAYKFFSLGELLRTLMESESLSRGILI